MFDTIGSIEPESKPWARRVKVAIAAIALIAIAIICYKNRVNVWQPVWSLFR